MAMFDALVFAEYDEAGTAANEQAAQESANSLKAFKVGELVLQGVAADEATALAEGFVEPYRAYHRRYDIDPDIAYPAVITWIVENHQRLNELLKMNDQQLIDLREDGDTVARFVHRARHALSRLLAIPLSSYKSALVPHDEAAEWAYADDILERDRALKAAQLIFIEALHQQVVDAANEVREPGTPRVNVPIQPHFLKRTAWRYVNPSAV
jgi:hypothetical protein